MHEQVAFKEAHKKKKTKHKSLELLASQYWNWNWQLHWKFSYRCPELDDPRPKPFHTRGISKVMLVMQNINRGVKWACKIIIHNNSTQSKMGHFKRASFKNFKNLRNKTTAFTILDNPNYISYAYTTATYA